MEGGSSSNRTVNSESSDDGPYDLMPVDFEWTPYRDRKFWEHCKDTLPFGMNKHMNMIVFRNRLSKEFKLTIPAEYLWARLRAKLDLKELDNNTPLEFKYEQKIFTLSSEYNELIINQSIKRGRKKNSRNVSESSFSSDKSKQLRSHKNSLTDITVSESSSRSVTPEILRGKAPNRSITPETTSRKSNLRSSDKDQKIKQGLEKASTKHEHVDLGLPELKIERFKPESSEKQYANLTESKLKPRNSTPNKTETNANKSKRRNRVSSDIFVVQQLELLPLGRRSCINKNE